MFSDKYMSRQTRMHTYTLLAVAEEITTVSTTGNNVTAIVTVQLLKKEGTVLKVVG